MKELIFGMLGMVLILSGCGVKDPGTRTLTFDPEGVKITSETYTMEAKYLGDIEKEKTRQICYKQKAKADAKVFDAVKDNPFVLALIRQADALNNALSLLKTGKNYDPCPSSTNSSDVEIADAGMYSSIYSDAFGLLKFGVGAWAGVEIADSFISGLAGGYSLNAFGENSTITVNDAFKDSMVGNGSTVSGVFTDQTTEVVEVIELPE